MSTFVNLYRFLRKLDIDAFVHFTQIYIYIQGQFVCELTPSRKIYHSPLGYNFLTLPLTTYKFLLSYLAKYIFAITICITDVNHNKSITGPMLEQKLGNFRGGNKNLPDKPRSINFGCLLHYSHSMTALLDFQFMVYY